MTSTTSSVRRLYANLCAEFGGEDDVRDNLMALESYQALAGSGEARFCEWAYHSTEERCLIRDLCAILRPTDSTRLAKLAGCAEEQLRGLGREAVTRLALIQIGVKEPEIPDRLFDGVANLQDVRNRLLEVIQGRSLITQDPAPNDIGGVAGRCRRAAERLLKVITVFLWDGGYAEAITRVVHEGRHGFRPGPRRLDVHGATLFQYDLGTSNHLLKALNHELRSVRVVVPFLRGHDEVWSQRAFDAMARLGEHLNEALHDGHGRGPIDGPRLLESVDGVLGCVHDQVIRVPRSIRFFRRYEDGQSEDFRHYEGYLDDGKRVRCFEVAERYELHTPYLFLAATNPSAVSMICTPRRAEFLERL